MVGVVCCRRLLSSNLSLCKPWPSFHYHSSYLPDTYNPITFYSSAQARASLHRHKHIDPTSQPANHKGRRKTTQIHKQTINRERSANVFKNKFNFVLLGILLLINYPYCRSAGNEWDKLNYFWLSTPGITPLPLRKWREPIKRYQASIGVWGLRPRAFFLLSCPTTISPHPFEKRLDSPLQKIFVEYLSDKKERHKTPTVLVKNGKWPPALSSTSIYRAMAERDDSRFSKGNGKWRQQHLVGMRCTEANNARTENSQLT